MGYFDNVDERALRAARQKKAAQAEEAKRVSLLEWQQFKSVDVPRIVADYAAKKAHITQPERLPLEKRGLFGPKYVDVWPLWMSDTGHSVYYVDAQGKVYLHVYAVGGRTARPVSHDTFGYAVSDWDPGYWRAFDRQKQIAAVVAELRRSLGG